MKYLGCASFAYAEHEKLALVCDASIVQIAFFTFKAVNKIK